MDRLAPDAQQESPEVALTRMGKDMRVSDWTIWDWISGWRRCIWTDFEGIEVLLMIEHPD
jgi:hypothetical protein